MSTSIELFGSTVSVSCFGGLAKAALGVAIIIAAPIANTTAIKVILEFMFYL
jgi:hypothetical protein